MTAKPTPTPTVPAPRFTYQGSGLSLLGTSLQIGPFSFSSQPGVVLGHAANFGATDGVPWLELRPQRIAVGVDPSTEQFAMGYEQAGVEWDMIFRVTTDPGGGMVGGAFALDVQSNYPQIPMAMAKQPIPQASYGALTRHELPADYRAQMTLHYWAQGHAEPPIDAWLMVEIGYVPPAARGKPFARPGDTPMIPVGQAYLFPAHRETAGGVLGKNYPAQVGMRGRR